MGTQTLSRLINAPVSRVFSISTDLENIPKYIPAIVRIERLDDASKPVGVGTHWRETRKMMGNDAVVELWFTEFERDRACTIVSEGVGCRFTTRFEFTEQGQKTKAEVTITTTPLTFVGRLMSLMVKGAITKGIGQDLEAIAREAEKG